MSEAATTPTSDEKKPRTLEDITNETRNKLLEVGILNYQLEHDIPSQKRNLYNEIHDLDREAKKMHKQMQAMQDAMKKNGKETDINPDTSPKATQPDTTIQ